MDGTYGPFKMDWAFFHARDWNNLAWQRCEGTCRELVLFKAEPVTLIFWNRVLSRKRSKRFHLLPQIRRRYIDNAFRPLLKVPEGFGFVEEPNCDRPSQSPER